MKRQLNFWTHKPGTYEEVNVSLSIEDNKQFTVIFRRPGSTKSIAQVATDINNEDVYNLTYAFETSGCLTFHDEMDERIYFANIARQKEDVKRAENLGVTTCWSVLFYIACMIVSVVFFNIPILFALGVSLFLSILLSYFLWKRLVIKGQ